MNSRKVKDPDVIRVRKDMIKDSKVLPSFIDGFSYTQRECFELAKLMVVNISLLISDKVISNRDIDILNNRVNDGFNTMFDYDKEASLLYWQYLLDLVDHYQIQCLDKEMFESCANIESFKTQYLLPTS